MVREKFKSIAVAMFVTLLSVYASSSFSLDREKKEQQELLPPSEHSVELPSAISQWGDSDNEKVPTITATDMEQCAAERKTLNGMAASIKSQSAVIDAERLSIKQDFQHLEKLRAGLASERALLEKQQKELSIESEGLNHERAEIDKLKSDAKNKKAVAEISRRISVFNTRIETMNATVNATNGKIAQTRLEEDKYGDELDLYNQRINAMNAKVDVMNEDINRFTERANTFDDKCTGHRRVIQ